MILSFLSFFKFHFFLLFSIITLRVILLDCLLFIFMTRKFPQIQGVPINKEYMRAGELGWESVNPEFSVGGGSTPYDTMNRVALSLG